MFSLKVIFYFTKTENRTKNSLTQLSHTIALSKSTILAKKNTDFLQKNADISKIKRALVLKRIFSEIAYACVLTYQISSF